MESTQSFFLSMKRGVGHLITAGIRSQGPLSLCGLLESTNLFHMPFFLTNYSTISKALTL